MKAKFSKFLSVIAMVVPVVSSDAILAQRTPDRNERGDEGIVYKNLHDGDSATLIGTQSKG